MESLTDEQVAQYEKWVSYQMDLNHPATVLPSNDHKWVPRQEQFWDWRLA